MIEKNIASNRKKKFWIFVFLLYLSTVADLGITYVGTPDLSLEGNPLVSIFNLGWTALLTSNVIALILCTWLIYYTFLQYKRPVIQCDSYKQYISMLYYQRPDKFNWTFYKFPKNKSIIPATIGYTGAIIIPLIRIYFVTEWIGFIYFHDFIHLFYCQNIMLWRTIVFSIIILYGIFLGYYWGWIEYQANKKLSEN
jgi:hypothetical protein